MAFVERDAFFDAALPDNVTMSFQPYAPSEADLVRAFRAAGVHAAYLGLCRIPAQVCFARYSLSSKLATYAAAGLPVIVDGPADAEAWKLVQAYAAGILCEGNAAAARERLQVVFGNAEARQRMGEGARRLCRERFDLTANVRGFAELLARGAEKTA